MFHSAYYTAGGAVRQVTYQCNVQIIVQEGFPLPPMSPLGGGVSRRAAAAPLPASSNCTLQGNKRSPYWTTSEAPPTRSAEDFSSSLTDIARVRLCVFRRKGGLCVGGEWKHGIRPPRSRRGQGLASEQRLPSLVSKCGVALRFLQRSFSLKRKVTLTLDVTLIRCLSLEFIKQNCHVLRSVSVDLIKCCLIDGCFVNTNYMPCLNVVVVGLAIKGKQNRCL